MNARSRVVSLVFLAALAGGCAHVATLPGTGGPAAPAAHGAPGRYEAVAGRGADIVAELRAAPPPAEPEIVDSQSSAGDERVLSDKGYVRIGDGYYASVDADARAWLKRKAVEVGADKAMFYETSPADAAPSLHAAYYVRFRLPFGASFRDLTAEERAAVGASGVRIGAVIGGSPAAEANLREGDIVLKFDGAPVASRAEFERQLRAHMGKHVTLTIQRDGAAFSRLVRLGVLASELGRDK
ncbi:MAG TPA: PDZ domain-containing protein [Rudaea sp.]|nr:PDZ domain-containing protein [Rudaea sp.]